MVDEPGAGRLLNQSSTQLDDEWDHKWVPGGQHVDCHLRWARADQDVRCATQGESVPRGAKKPELAVPGLADLTRTSVRTRWRSGTFIVDVISDGLAGFGGGMFAFRAPDPGSWSVTAGCLGVSALGGSLTAWSWLVERRRSRFSHADMMADQATMT
jgi:hypothetical protein